MWNIGSDAAYVEHRSFATSFSCRESIVAMTRASGASSAALPAAFPAFVLVVLAVTGGALGQYAGYQEKVITHNTLAQYAEILLPQAGAAQQISCDQNMLIVVWKGFPSRVTRKPELHVAVQLWLDNGGTAQCECCYPPWDSTDPDYTFLIQYLNETGMPGSWSYNVGLLQCFIQHYGQSEVLNTDYCRASSVSCHMDNKDIS